MLLMYAVAAKLARGLPNHRAAAGRPGEMCVGVSLTAKFARVKASEISGESIERPDAAPAKNNLLIYQGFT